MISDLPQIYRVELDDAEVLENSTHKNHVSGNVEILGSNKQNKDKEKRCL